MVPRPTTTPDDEPRAFCPRCGGSFPSGFRSCTTCATGLVGTDPLIGSTLVERYQIERLLGEGGLGRVYLARHTRMARRFAIKVPAGRAVSDPKSRRRFVAEAEAASRLDHPNVVGVVDFGETPQGLVYLVMELAEGETLGAYLERRGRLDTREALGVVRQLALGLDHAHGVGLVHRDLKPDNVILVEPDHRPRIVDFGLAILRELDEAGRLTTRGVVIGTPHYMSPEQACGHRIDLRSDIFSLGIVFYELLAGVLPFDGAPIDIAQKNVLARVPEIAIRVPGLTVDREVEELVHRMVAKHPAARPQSATDVIAAIDEILDRLAAERGRERDSRRRAPRGTMPGMGTPPKKQS
jgi:serine/threonine-protein kinase